MSRADAAFTLLEVLAAVTIFVLVMTVLVGTSGEASVRIRQMATRLEASELADQELARIEAALVSQMTPPEDREETIDDFVVRVWSQPAIDDFGGGAPAGGAGAADDPLAGLAGQALVGPMIAMQAPGIDAFLLRYEIRVDWVDGARPESIRRTTYAFDWEAARLALPELFQDAAGPGGESLGEDAGGAGSDAQRLIEQIQEAR